MIDSTSSSNQGTWDVLRGVRNDFEIVLLVHSQLADEARRRSYVVNLMADDHNLIAYEQSDSISHIVRHLQPALHIDVDRNRAEFLEAHVPAVEFLHRSRTAADIDLRSYL